MAPVAFVTGSLLAQVTLAQGFERLFKNMANIFTTDNLPLEMCARKLKRGGWQQHDRGLPAQNQHLAFYSASTLHEVNS